MATETLEERVTQLEVEMAHLKAGKESGVRERPGVIGRTSPDLWERFRGMYANDPVFDEVQKRIAQEREREREEARKADEESAP